MDLRLRGQVVLVTGAGQGLGRAIGLGFAREGARVAFLLLTSPLSSWTTGPVISINGGYAMV